MGMLIEILAVGERLEVIKLEVTVKREFGQRDVRRREDICMKDRRRSGNLQILGSDSIVDIGNFI
jgi:hypothetical protein